MSEGRQNMVYLVVGRIGSGKTDEIKNIAQTIYENNANINKLVVFDEFDTDVWHTMETWNHPEWVQYRLPIISEKQLLRLKKGQVRLIQTIDNNDHYFYLFRKLRNCIVIIEDATRMVDPQEKLPKSLGRLLFDVKQKNIELILVFHSLMEVPAKLGRHARIIILKHTDEQECPKKFANPKIKLAFDKLKSMNPDETPFERIAIPVNVNLKTQR